MSASSTHSTSRPSGRTSPYFSTSSGWATAILIGSQPAAAKAEATLAIQATPPTSIRALSRPIRLLLPPAKSKDRILSPQIVEPLHGITNFFHQLSGSGK